MSDQTQYSILLVDDLPVNIDILATALSNYRIFVAKNGERALAIINGGVKPDLILLDVEMPGMNGYQVCEEIRSDKRYESIPIIFLTAKTDRESILRGFHVGGQDYVTKPFDLHELVARVNTHLELKRSKEDLAELNAMLEHRVEERTRALRATLDKLEATNKELDTFVYRASHDLKGPTASLLGLVYVGKELPVDHISDILDKIENTIGNLNKVLDKLMLKHVMANIPVDYKPIDLRELIRESKKSLKGSFPEYEIIAPEEWPVFYSDFDSLKIILENLFENALIFNSSDRVTIRVTVKKTMEHIILAVEDNGDGITHEVEDKVFDLFFRGSTKSRGNGLGLYLVKKAVEKLNGSIGLSTHEGRFTKVSIYLPVATALELVPVPRSDQYLIA